MVATLAKNAHYLNDDPYRTSARTYGIAQLSSCLNPEVYNPDPTTKLAKLCGLLGRTTKVKEEDKPTVPEPTNYMKVALALIILITVFLPMRHSISLTNKTEKQKVVFTSISFMICSLMVAFYMYAR